MIARLPASCCDFVVFECADGSRLFSWRSCVASAVDICYTVACKVSGWLVVCVLSIKMMLVALSRFYISPALNKIVDLGKYESASNLPQTRNK